MSFGVMEPIGAARVSQVTPQQVAITRKSTQLITNVMVKVVGGRNNPENGFSAVRNVPDIESGVGSRIDFQA